MRPTPDWGPSRLGDRVKFRKSMNNVKGRQLYVLGVERQETEMVEMARYHPSCADLGQFVADVHEQGDQIDTAVWLHSRPRSVKSRESSSIKKQKQSPAHKP